MGQGVVERNLGGTQDSSEIICDESFEEVVSISLHLGIYEGMHILFLFFLAKETYDAFVMLKVGEASFSAVAVFPSQP